MKNLIVCVLVAVAFLWSPALRAEVDPVQNLSFQPIHDTYATHNDNTVHGLEDIIRVGIEPQQCEPGGWDPCDKDDLECCVKDEQYNYCAPPGECDTYEPQWSAHRKFRAYIRFNLNSIPPGEIQKAVLRLTAVNVQSLMGGQPNIEVYRLKSIGDGICEWNEATLNDTNFTTWSSLPQNVSMSPEGVWAFDVTKAVRDWTTGDTDFTALPIQPNCGFHLADPDFGKKDAPLARWVDFSSKEGGAAPELVVLVAQDLDGDGYFGDCNEEDPNIHPGAVETCDGVDEDCDGEIDEENCDGLDNDCDGQVDEGEDLCGPGMMCIYHQCVVSCDDDCSGPFDLKCEFNDDNGLWEKWACDDTDDDPCLDWYKVKDCEQGDFCQFGYCSGNCVDLCEPEEFGKKSCFKDHLGLWHVAECGDWDSDGCIEWGKLDPCGPAATCEDAQCIGGCTDDCEDLGLVQCLDPYSVVACMDQDDNGCLEWVLVGQCPEDKQCDQGECGGINPVCVDQCIMGTSKCDDLDGTPAVYSCVADADEDECLEWKKLGDCQWGCDGDLCAEVPDELYPDPEPDIIQPVEEPMTPDVPVFEDGVGLEEIVADLAHDAGTQPGPDGAEGDQAAQVDIGSSPGDDLAMADSGNQPPLLVEEEGGGDDGGCDCRVTAGHHRPFRAGWLFLLLAATVLFFVARTRYQRS